MQQGFFGITWPKPSVVWNFCSASIAACCRSLRFWCWSRSVLGDVAGAEHACRGGCDSLVLCSFLWINASYYYWEGGWSTGPRHLVPMLPLCCLALAFAWPRAFWARTVALVLLAASLSCP